MTSRRLVLSRRTGIVLLSAALAAPACTPSAEGVPEPGRIPAPVADLARLHDEIRVEGLDDRRFDQETLGRAMTGSRIGGYSIRTPEAGRSAEGRPIPLFSYGDGPTPVLLWSQMHGDESTASMALADMHAFFTERPDHPVARVILRALTVHTIPMLNPDGAARFQRRNAQGVDINRDARALATPEGRYLRWAIDALEPRFGFNLHDQNVRTRVEGTGRGVAIALLAPAFDESREVNDVRRRAMEVAGVIRRAIEPMVGGHIARYDDTFNPRAFGDLATRWGVSTILVESGGWEDDPQKQFLRKVNFVALLAALETIARESYRGLGTEPYESLPENGRAVGDLLVVGGTVAVPGLPPLEADLLVNYTEPLLKRGGTVADVGDLADYEARDTIPAHGLFLVPTETALERSAGGVQLQPGAPARFVASRTPDGSDPVWRFDGRPPPEHDLPPRDRIPRDR